MAGGPTRIVSGGQSGVDRAALDFAAGHGLATGGWCPRGGFAEDYPHPPGVRLKYSQLKETPSDDPDQRTRWNVRDSDATLIIVASDIEVSEGSVFTLACAVALGRPHLVVDLTASGAVRTARDWIGRIAPQTLNIAGPRESQSPGVYREAMRFLEDVLGTPSPRSSDEG
jgi:hypothetical protein